jgi:UDP-N-acetylmuramoyl-tripeptide--D-alanyl-D-alanine ligase
VATGLFFDVDMKDIADAVENYMPANNRSQVKTTKNNTLVCDSYNANPTSMNAAIESFSALAADKKLVILGDMLELGERADEEHSKVLEKLEALSLNNILLVGPVFRKVSAGKSFKTFLDLKELSGYLIKQPVKGYTILIKGSRGIGLEKAYELL